MIRGGEKEHRYTRNLFLIILSCVIVSIFFLLFLFQNIGPLDFWWWFVMNIIISLFLATRFDTFYISALIEDFSHKTMRKVLLGVISAVILYFVFFLGDIVSRSILPFSVSGIQGVYQLREGASLWRITTLIILFIGPGEELLWRGFLQEQYARSFNSTIGFTVAVTLYVLVHTGSGNVMLIISAGIAGMYWGLLYRRTKSVLLNVVSHVIWDLAVFIVFPFHG
jgi:membrane protease YdiL (CAAX protease family)